MRHHRVFIALAMWFFCVTAGAQQLRMDARNAAIGDGASTALGLALGAAEMNPIGPVLTAAVKVAVMRHAATLPDTEQAAAYAMASALWSGATANNLCVAAAIVTGGGFAPVCVLVGAAWGLRVWNQTENERIFWSEGCPTMRQYSGIPDLPCIYTPIVEDSVIVVKSSSNIEAN